MFQGKSGVPAVVLEAIADHSCRFWHFNFGSPGALNDINVLDRSPLFSMLFRGKLQGLNIPLMAMNTLYHTGWRMESTPTMLVL